MPSDTTPAAARTQRQVLQRMGPAGRFTLMAELTDEVITLAQRAIRRNEPHLTEQQLLARFIEQHYGSDLANAVRRRWQVP